MIRKAVSSAITTADKIRSMKWKFGIVILRWKEDVGDLGFDHSITIITNVFSRKLIYGDAVSRLLTDADQAAPVSPTVRRRVDRRE